MRIILDFGHAADGAGVSIAVIAFEAATVARDTGEAVFPKIMTKDRTKQFCMRIPVVRHLLYGQQVLCASLCQMTPVFVLPVAIGATKCW